MTTLTLPMALITESVIYTCEYVNQS